MLNETVNTTTDKPTSEANGVTMPFGKFRGRSVTNMITEDRDYSEWLVKQPWVIEKFKPLYQLITANLKG